MKAYGPFDREIEMNSEIKIPNHQNRTAIGIGIVVTVSLLFTAHFTWVWEHHPHNFQQLAKAFSSIEALQGTPVVNHGGNLVGMVHNTPQGTGIFIANIPAQTEQTICEAKETDVVGNPRVFGWSPDDCTFAYRWNIGLHFVNTNGLEYPGEIPTPYLESFTWLTPDSCAYIDQDTKVDNGKQVAIAQNIQGKWQETASWPLSTTNETPRALLAMSPNVVAWRTDNSIRQMDLSTGEIKTLYSNQKGAITSLSYSSDTGEFLFVETTNRERTSSLFALSNGSKTLKPTGKYPIKDAQWINKGKGYAYLIPARDDTSLFIQGEEGPTGKTFFSSGQVESIIGVGENSHVYALASYTNEAPSIWLCDSDIENARCLFSPCGFATVPIHFQPALVGYAPMPDKHYEEFVLIPPANFSRQKKYPLIIGMQGYDWMNVAHATYSQTLANSGVYVALTGYHYVPQRTKEALLAYANNVLAVYNQMAKNPNVDTSRVYIFAFSSSTIVINQLIDDYPGRWRGVMLFSPTASLPTTKTGRLLPPILVTAGSDEDALWKRFPAYQETLAQAGVPVEWYVHPDEGHIERSQNTMYQRALLMGRMIFGD